MKNLTTYWNKEQGVKELCRKCTHEFLSQTSIYKNQSFEPKTWNKTHKNTHILVKAYKLFISCSSMALDVQHPRKINGWNIIHGGLVQMIVPFFSWMICIGSSRLIFQGEIMAFASGGPSNSWSWKITSPRCALYCFPARAEPSSFGGWFGGIFFPTGPTKGGLCLFSGLNDTKIDSSNGGGLIMVIYIPW